MTGLENVYLNGSILGMGRRDLRSRCGAIVEFAELGEVIDSPLRYYSAGMQVRLGFAIAAHLDLDALLIDEVLTVGDEDFRARCQAKIRELLDQGKTLVLVSHALEEIAQYTRRVVWMAGGKIREAGPPDVVLPAYRRSFAR